MNIKSIRASMVKRAGEDFESFYNGPFKTDPRYVEERETLSRHGNHINRRKEVLTTNETAEPIPWWVKLLAPIESFKAYRRSRSFENQKAKLEKKYKNETASAVDDSFKLLRGTYDQWREDQRTLRDKPKSKKSSK